jgi:hypothetical protein
VLYQATIRFSLVGMNVVPTMAVSGADAGRGSGLAADLAHDAVTG